MKRYIDKETGEKKSFGNLQVYAEAENTNESKFLGNFDSFKQILESYEDYIPKEPLIKDEKVRTAVRAWAEVSHLVEFQIYNEDELDQWCQIDGRIDGSADTHSISFNGIIIGAVPGAKYTIYELCGEEEE